MSYQGQVGYFQNVLHGEEEYADEFVVNYEGHVGHPGQRDKRSPRQEGVDQS
jgi:hypothetical protein